MKRQAILLSTPQVWRRGHGPEHPLKPERLKRTYELLQAYGAFDGQDVRVVEPRPATEEELALFHTPEYVALVRSLSEGEERPNAWRYGFGPGDNPIFEGMFDSERLKVGSALVGAEMLAAGQCDVAFSYSGGLHHAGRERASGFCVFNDAAVAISWLIQQGLRVAYVDVDVHHGDGVQEAFYDTDQVLTISLHQDGRTLFPGTGFVEEVGQGAGEGFSINLPLPPGTDDDLYFWAFEEVVPPLVRRFEPDLLVSQLGVDTHYRDPLAQLALTTHGQEAVFEALSHLAPVWLALGGGGYALEVVPRAWTLAFGVMTGQPFPDSLPASFRAAYGESQLHDPADLTLRAGSYPRIRSMVEAVVERVQQRHKIGRGD
jgi:acetoin utilization protein AcuC